MFSKTSGRVERLWQCFRRRCDARVEVDARTHAVGTLSSPEVRFSECSVRVNSVHVRVSEPNGPFPCAQRHFARGS